MSNRLLITSEDHYSVGSTGATYSRGPTQYASWSRYLDVFDDVVVLARVATSDRQEHARESADGPRISFAPLPDFTGPTQYLRARRHARAIARRAITKCSAYLLRMPGVVSQMVWREIVSLRKPYALEVVGDPWDAFGPGTWPNISRPAFRLFATRQLQRICNGAIAINYVTSTSLQKRYPPCKTAFAVSNSDVNLENDPVPGHTIQTRRQRLRDSPWNDPLGSPLRIGFIGSFARMYKGPDTLLHAAALCQPQCNLQLALIGAGHHLPEMKALATTLGIARRIEFRGEIPSGRPIFEFLDSIDLFAMPSRAEGLPRALVEAMSRGCPCIASAVGGIPELLEATDLVPPNSSKKLAELILQVAADPDRLLAMSARNLAKAAQFNPQTLKESRRAFLEEVKRRSSQP